MLGADVGDERHEHRTASGVRVMDPREHEPDDDAEDEADQHAEDDRLDELERDLPAVMSPVTPRDGHLVGDEGRRVVEHALALEDGDQPVGQPEPRATAVAATGSGGDTMAPSTHATDHGRPAACATTATTATVARVSPTASTNTAPACSRNSVTVVRCVAAKSSGGRTTGRMSAGSKDSGLAGVTSARASPKIVSSTGCGTRTRSATGVSTMTPSMMTRASTSASTVRTSRQQARWRLSPRCRARRGRRG